MTTGRGTKVALSIFAVVAFLFVYIPLAVVLINSFNAGETLSWPPQGFSVRWWEAAASNEGVREALVTSVVLGICATAVALVLGTLAALALGRYNFFGRDSVSLLIILPIALPGIVTGIALNNVFTTFLGGLTFFTLIVAHSTFCIVVVYNNALARFRRTAGSMIEASMDLGADGFQTFRYVVLPQIGSALLAGGMLAFALSFDEVIVTTFTAGQQTTLPIWMLNELIRPRQRPITNVVAIFVIIVTFIPILAAYYLTREGEHTGGAGK